jgi:hypothetical protein
VFSTHLHITPADGLLEGLTGDSCEKGGRHVGQPSSPYRREAQAYLRSCEHPLAAAATSQFSEEELAMIGYYAAEVQKILPVLIAK